MYNHVINLLYVKEAAHYLRMAADLEHCVAMFLLAILLYIGYGIDKK